jgi:hypothetical protein
MTARRVPMIRCFLDRGVAACIVGLPRGWSRPRCSDGAERVEAPGAGPSGGPRSDRRLWALAAGDGAPAFADRLDDRDALRWHGRGRSGLALAPSIRLGGRATDRGAGSPLLDGSQAKTARAAEAGAPGHAASGDLDLSATRPRASDLALVAPSRGLLAIWGNPHSGGPHRPCGNSPAHAGCCYSIAPITRAGMRAVRLTPAMPRPIATVVSDRDASGSGVLGVPAARPSSMARTPGVSDRRRRSAAAARMSRRWSSGISTTSIGMPHCTLGAGNVVIRHPSLKGLRENKSPRKVKAERAAR